MGEHIPFKANGATTPAYLSSPDQAGKMMMSLRIEDAARDLAAAADLGKPHTFHTYADATHAFFNEERRDVYDPAAAKDAWAKTLAFFRRELRA